MLAVAQFNAIKKPFSGSMINFRRLKCINNCSKFIHYGSIFWLLGDEPYSSAPLVHHKSVVPAIALAMMGFPLHGLPGLLVNFGEKSVTGKVMINFGEVKFAGQRHGLLIKLGTANQKHFGHIVT